jgi:hypothetical protein
VEEEGKKGKPGEMRIWEEKQQMAKPKGKSE